MPHPYATLDDVFVRYRPNRTMVGSGDYDVSSSEVASVYVAQAQAYADAWLANRYEVPLSVVSPLITMVTADLAIFHMLAEKMPSVPDFMVERKKRADEILKMLVDGKMVIASASVVTSAGDSYAWSPTMGQHPIFSPVLGELEQTADTDRVNTDRDDRGYDTNNDCG